MHVMSDMHVRAVANLGGVVCSVAAAVLGVGGALAPAAGRGRRRGCGDAGRGGHAEDADAQLAQLRVGCLLRCLELGARNHAVEAFVQLGLHVLDVGFHLLWKSSFRQRFVSDG
jgi:hypothetical protein